MTYAPIAIFAYNRPRHLSALINSLLENPESRLSKIYIFVDGPKNQNDEKCIEEIELCINGFKDSLDIVARFSPQNKGLSDSILSGVDMSLDMHERIIVLEDDLVLARNFLKFCNEGLDLFADDKKVASVQGYSPIVLPFHESTYFLKGADCQGWATWRDRWRLVCRDSSLLLDEIKKRNLSKEFDLDGSFPYADMLERQAKGKVESWAIRWHASMFLNGKVSVYPGRTLVMNIGFDGSGTHKGSFGGEVNSLPPHDYFPRFDIHKVEESIEARKLIIRQSRKRYKIFPIWHPKGFLKLLVKPLVRLFSTQE